MLFNMAIYKGEYRSVSMPPGRRVHPWVILEYFHVYEGIEMRVVNTILMFFNDDINL